MTTNTSTIITVLVLAAAFAIHTPGARALDDTEVQVIFDKMDANHDGMVTHTEFTLEKVAVIALIDKNNDGSLSRDEVLISDEAFAEVDGNQDGSVSYVEFVQGGLGRFENLDHNRYGVV